MTITDCYYYDAANDPSGLGQPRICWTDEHGVPRSMVASAGLTIEEVCVALEEVWGHRPICILACAGGSDQHWQVYHPEHMGLECMPAHILRDGVLREHPDSPLA